MPTGYTYGIIEGKINTFKEFATTCMRAFVMHMRDDPNDKEYYDREPSDYHKKAIKSAKRKLKKIKALSDEDIISVETKRLKKDRRYHNNSNRTTIENKKKLVKLLNEAKLYNPPTSQHQGIKDFMIEQLTSTIDFDGNNNYHLKAIAEIDYSLNEMNLNKIRKEIMRQANWDLDYHEKEHKEEVERCDDSNKWASDFIKSL